MRAWLEATKFHQISRSPTGSPPSTMTVAWVRALTVGSALDDSTTI